MAPEVLVRVWTNLGRMRVTVVVREVKGCPAAGQARVLAKGRRLVRSHLEESGLEASLERMLATVVSGLTFKGS